MMNWKVFIYFLCPSPELATEAGYVLDRDPNLVPAQCEIVAQPGTVTEVVNIIVGPWSGREIAIGRVVMWNGKKGWSAGFMPAMS